ncbi:MAG: C40 family peptidase [Eggerthellaceae bacterium]|nr:C40 family peptidase [Eggerthellaceae bacterium]
MMHNSKAFACGTFTTFALAIFMAAMICIPQAFAVTAAEKEAEAEEALTQLHALQETLEQTSAQYYQSLAEYQDAVNLRDAAQKRVESIGVEIADIQKNLNARVREMYRSGSTTFLDLLFGSATFEEFTKNWEILNRVNQNEAAMVDKQRKLKTTAENEKAEYSKQASIAEEKSKEANQAFKKSQKLVDQMQETYDGLSKEAAKLYQEEQEAAARAAAEAAAAEAAAAEAAAAEAAYYEEDFVGGIQNEDGTVTDAQTGEVYASASEYSASTGNEIVDRAYSMLGSSYRYGGTGADGSFDCSGLVGYALTGTNERIGNTLTFMEYNQVSDPQPGDIVVSEGHTGIYIGDGQMIHAQDEEHGVVVGKVQDDMIYVRP